MGLLLILPFLVSGYYICLNHPKYRQSLHKYEGQLLYLLVAKEGIRCFAIASAFSMLAVLASKISIPVAIDSCNITYTSQISLDYFSLLRSWFLEHGLSNEKNSDIAAFISQAALFCIFVPKLYTSYTEKKLLKKTGLQTLEELEWFLMNKVLEGNPKLDLLMKSINNKNDRYMFTMEDRKVYVGRVISIGKPTESEGVEEYFSLVPMLSGYRNKDSLEIEFNTEYVNAPHDLYILLAQDNIVSATKFNNELWQAFKNKKEDRKLLSKVKKLVTPPTHP